MRSGRDATRRNRNIGTAKRGHGQSNKLVIATRGADYARHYERLKSFKTATREINGVRLTFLVEKTRADSFHACTVDDVTHVLQHLPPADLRGVELIVLRQPKRKEEVLEPVWGRLAYYVEIGEHRGRAIFLEAVDLSKSERRSKSLGPEAELELERLRRDGHEIISTGRHHIISKTLESVRSTQLYRTLLHEIGHHVDEARNPDAFERKITSEKEVFAHRYAEALGQELSEKNLIPFDRMLDTGRIEQDGLLMSDFAVI